MLQLALDAFARLDVNAATEVIDLDDEIDAAFSAILRQLISYMMEDPRTISPALEIVFMAKSIERIGDHAKNIAEAVVQVVQGHRRAPRDGRADPRGGRRGMSVEPMMPTILVVEDEPAILELLKVNLVDAGYEVREAADAETAHALLKEALPDLVLLDWMLPGQSGLAFAKQLRADARTKELPVIMVTARTDEADRVAGLEAWVDDYVTKPFSPRELKARIKSVLRRRAPEAAQEPLPRGRAQARPARRIA